MATSSASSAKLYADMSRPTVIGGSAVETTSTVSEPPKMPAPDTLAVRSPEAVGANENFDAAIVSSLVASPTSKVTSCSRSELPSQDCSWTMVTVATSSSVVPPARVRVNFRSSSPPPISSCSASMVTGVMVTPQTAHGPSPSSLVARTCTS